MIGFDHQDAAVPEPVGNKSRRDSQIGGDAHLPVGGLYRETDRGCCIMSDGEGTDLEVAEIDKISGLEFPDIPHPAQTGQRLDSRLVSEHRKIVSSSHDPESAAMIMVFMGDENGVEIICLDTDPLKTPRKFASGQPRVDQDAALAAFYIQSISLASAG